MAIVRVVTLVRTVPCYVAGTSWKWLFWRVGCENHQFLDNTTIDADLRPDFLLLKGRYESRITDHADCSIDGKRPLALEGARFLIVAAWCQ